MRAIDSKKSEWLIREQPKNPLEIPEVVNLISRKIQEMGFGRSLESVSKVFFEENRFIINNLWKKILQDSQTDAFQKTHPTLSSYIQTQKVTNFVALTTQLRKEAHRLDLTETDEFRKTETSIAPKDLLALDKIIEQTNFNRVNQDTNLWELLTLVPPEIQTYENWNEITNILRAANQLHGLRGMNFINLGLTRIPNGICNFTALRCLALVGNKLETLPVNFGNLTNLKYLYLSDNELQTLPMSFGNLTALECLNLSDNPLQDLPSTIAHTALEELYPVRIFKNRIEVTRLFQELNPIKQPEVFELSLAGVVSDVIKVLALYKAFG